MNSNKLQQLAGTRTLLSAIKEPIFLRAANPWAEAADVRGRFFRSRCRATISPGKGKKEENVHFKLFARSNSG
jgi:hypothetical protein